MRFDHSRQRHRATQSFSHVTAAVSRRQVLLYLMRLMDLYEKSCDTFALQYGDFVAHKKGHTSVKDAVDGAVKILTVAVTIMVVAVPKGLPLAVTLILAYSMIKMMANKALLRRLSTCEMIGSTTTICNDKTGTLTLNQKYYMASSRELVCIVSIQKSPIINIFGESIAGASTIRGFGQEKRFIKRNLYLLDCFSRPFFCSLAAIEWLCLRSLQGEHANSSPWCNLRVSWW
ncbi:hypothetical protein KFK09_002435 [Dendrobium nobile]|uniref:Uncharacterized protein n=1 Tax=Dendrobium nobile TaxID=94219 RepID=A0A8T3C776_DENNO|nr:hypothetical protein KFK09_002435 [Dendrobium nobile]